MNKGLSYLASSNRWLYGLMILSWVLAVFFLKIPLQKKDNWYHILQHDALGYYVGLPTLFIYQDNQYSYLYDPDLNQRYGRDFPQIIKETKEGRRYTKYYYGTSILQSPFFFLGVATAWLTGAPMDGFSPPFQWCIWLAALFYALLGMLFLERWLRLKKLSNWAIQFTLLSLFLGTCLFNYVFNDAGFSHVYAFFTVSAFLYFQTRWFQDPKWKFLAGSAVFFGLTVFIRPTTGLVLLLLPLLAGSWQNLWAGIMRIFKSPFGWLCLMIPILFLLGQSAWYYWQTGQWWMWAYHGEGFDFSNPQWWQLLFGFRKGLFVYSPLLVLSLIGLVLLFEKKRLAGWTYTVFFITVTWVLSSWWCWWYGGSFGMRAFIDYFPVLALPFALSLEWLARYIRKPIVLLILFFFTGVSLVQHYQFMHHIIHYSKMNSEKYWQVFLRTDPFLSWVTTDPVDLIRNQQINSVKSYFTDFDAPTDRFDNKQPEKWTSQSPYRNREISCKVDNQEAYGARLVIPAEEIRDDRYRMVVEVTFDALYYRPDHHGLAVVGTQKEDGGRWMSQKLISSVRHQNSWGGARFHYDIGKLEPDEFGLYFYLLNDSPDPVWMDHLRVTVYYLEK